MQSREVHGSVIMRYVLAYCVYVYVRHVYAIALP